MMISFLLLLVVYLYGFYIELKIKSPFLFFYIGLLVLSIYPSFMNSFRFYELLYPENVYYIANLFSSLYLVIFILTRISLLQVFNTKKIWIQFLDNTNSNNYSELSRLYLVILIVCFSFFIYGLKLFSLSAILMFNWWDLVHANSLIVLMATYLSYACSGILVAAYTLQKPSIKYLSYALSLSFILFSVFVLKTRSYVLMFLLPYILYLFYKNKGIKRLKPILIILVAGILFVLARAVRHSTNLEEFANQSILDGFSSASSNAETTFINAFYFFINSHNDFPGFEKNYTLQRILLFWFRDFKPTEFSYLMHSAYFGSDPDEALSMHPTVFGDAYGNAWWFGALIYSFFLAFYISCLELSLRFFDSSRKYVSLALFSILAITSIIFARGAIYNAFMFSLLPLLFIYSYFIAKYLLKLK